MKMKHVTINTAKMEESIRFYKEIVGLEMKVDMRKMGAPIVFLADGEDPCIELIENPAQAYSGSGISIGFHREDVDAKRAELEEKGFARAGDIADKIEKGIKKCKEKLSLFYR